MGNSKVDKGQNFINEGRTLITETDSDRYLDQAARQRRSKKKEELYPIPEGGAGGFDDYTECWTE